MPSIEGKEIDMPNFDEFLKTVDPIALSEAAAKAAANHDNAFAGASQASTTVTIQLLRKYHEWLTVQLSELHQK